MSTLGYARIEVCKIMPNLVDEVKKLAHHGVIYGIGSVLSRLVGFLMIPLYTSYLTPTDYGVYQLTGITIDVIGIVLGFGLSGAIFRFYYDVKEESEKNCIISTAAIGVVVVGVLVLLVLGSQAKYIAHVVLDDSGSWIYIVLALATLWFNQQVDVVYAYLRVTESSKMFLVLSVAKLLVAMSLNIYLIAVLHYGIFGLFVSNLITAVIFACLSYPLLLKKIGMVFSLPVAKEMLQFSLPMVPANLASIIVNVSDRFFIKEFVSIAEAGIYGLGYRFGSVVFYFVRSPFMQIWGPRRFALYNEGASVEIYSKITTLFVGLMIFIGLCIAILIQDVIKIISPPEYWVAAYYAPAVVVCYIIYSLDQFVGFGILIEKKTKYWSYVNLSSAGINLLLNYLLISRFSAWGAIFSTFISLLFKIVALHFISTRLLYIPFEWYRMAGLFLVATVLFFCKIAMTSSSIAIAISYDVFLIGAFPVLVWYSPLISYKEKQVCINVIKKYVMQKRRWLR